MNPKKMYQNNCAEQVEEKERIKKRLRSNSSSYLYVKANVFNKKKRS